MEISVRVCRKVMKYTADIHIDGIDIVSLRSLDNDWLRNLVRPQVAAHLRFAEGLCDPKRIDDFVRAIVDGTPPPQSTCRGGKSGDSDSSHPGTPPHTEEDN